MTQRFAKNSDHAEYYAAYDTWASNNHHQHGFQMNATSPSPEGLAGRGLGVGRG